MTPKTASTCLVCVLLVAATIITLVIAAMMQFLGVDWSNGWAQFTCTTPALIFGVWAAITSIKYENSNRKQRPQRYCVKCGMGEWGEQLSPICSFNESKSTPGNPVFGGRGVFGFHEFPDVVGHETDVVHVERCAYCGKVKTLWSEGEECGVRKFVLENNAK